MTIIVVFGVAGSGKTTIGQLLAARLDLPFVEGDAFHDPAALASMATGRPLTDAERGPWLDRIHAELKGLQPAGAVCACSALNEWARQRLTNGLAAVRFVWLHGAPALIAERLAGRHGHPVGPALLPSQLAAFEPTSDPRVLRVEIDQSPTRVVDAIVDGLRPDSTTL